MHVTGDGTLNSSTARSEAGTHLTVASWNVNGQAGYAVDAHLRFLASNGCQLVALQEVTEDYFSVLRNHLSITNIAYSLDLRPPEKDAPRNRRLGCAVVTLDPSLAIRGATVIETTTCPERTIVAEVRSRRHLFQLASLHCPNGSNWKRKKGEWLHEVATWVRGQSKPTIFGIDANTPKNERLADSNPDKWWREDSHPAVGNGAQQLVGDIPRHDLRDVWKQLNREAVSYPVSHNRDNKPKKRSEFECRYDFIFASSHFTPVGCAYHYESVVQTTPRLSDHALVSATLTL